MPFPGGLEPRTIVPGACLWPALLAWVADNPPPHCIDSAKKPHCFMELQRLDLANYSMH